MQLISAERKKHIRFGRYVKDVVFAANDGIITTFAVVAGTAGASLSSSVVLIIGFANLIADGFSMATGNYLGTKSENDFYEREREIEKSEIKHTRDHELRETRQILELKGFKGEELERLVTLFASNEEFWADFMMHQELELFKPTDGSPVKNALATFLSFTIAGFVPLTPYIFGLESPFLLSSLLGGGALFTAGALRRFFSGRNWFLLGAEMLLMGGFAAGIAYYVGFLLERIFGV